MKFETPARPEEHARNPARGKTEQSAPGGKLGLDKAREAFLDCSESRQRLHRKPEIGFPRLRAPSGFEIRISSSASLDRGGRTLPKTRIDLGAMTKERTPVSSRKADRLSVTSGPSRESRARLSPSAAVTRQLEGQYAWNTQGGYVLGFLSATFEFDRASNLEAASPEPQPSKREV